MKKLSREEEVRAMHGLSFVVDNFYGLEYGDASRLAADFQDAVDTDGCTASEYIRRIGAGNIRPYLDSLKAGK